MGFIAQLKSRLAAACSRASTRTQLLGAFCAVLAMTLALGVVGLTGLQRVQTEAHELSGKWLPGVGELAAAKTAVLGARDLEIKHSRTADQSYQSDYEAQMADAAKAVDKALSAYEVEVAGDEERALVDKLKKTWGAYLQSQRRVVDLGHAGKQTDAADISDGASSMAADEVLLALEGLWTFNFHSAAQASERVEATYQRVRWGMSGLLAVAVLVGVGVALLFSRALLRRLGGEPGHAVEVARAVAQGDLSTPVAVRAGDTTSLMAQLHAMQGSLARAVDEVRHGSQGVASASAEIAHGNQDLSRRTEEQASALQQTAATMDELAATVRNNADNARQASELARGASDVARRGGEVVSRVVQTMKGIHDASNKIGDIISVIDGIAFQTNILALNAAVEAARAGEQGRGFAVVAGEVRSLAQRSAAAAKEIHGLITTSVERVGQGAALVDNAGKTMDEIVVAIQRVTGVVGEISAASAEQSTGVSQVGQAVARMDQTTQQNAALVEQSAAAAENLREQAQRLLQSVEVFRLLQD
ncbi:methyl-accepting chemotaxis protein [Ideonella sp. YS5]|uniref:methyl-accepting chemotaxis protein n=1 Tax=Ideonella sp. YS5 TaxID=3453714 RepID=UPI003EEC237A